MSDLISGEEKKNKSFLMGLVSGIAGVAVLGMIVFGILNFTTSGGGEEVVAGVGDEEEEVIGGEKVDLFISDADHVLGNKDAKIKVFEYSDFQCPYCSRFHEVMHQIVEEYPDDVAWVYRQFPIQSHPLGLPGAIATECAGEQGKFWEMSDIIFENQEVLSEESFVEFAAEIGLDVGAYTSCYDGGKYEQKIAVDYQGGIEAGVRGTPSSFVNGEIIPGALPYEQMKQVIESLLNN